MIEYDPKRDGIRDIAGPMVMSIAFALLGPELMAAEIEDPSGLDSNVLPTGSIADVIGDDTTGLLGLTGTPREPDAVPYTNVF